MESMEWYGTVHMDSMDYSMDSIWNGMEQAIWIPWTIPWTPYGMGLSQKNSPSPIWNPCSFHGLESMDSMD